MKIDKQALYADYKNIRANTDDAYSELMKKYNIGSPSEVFDIILEQIGEEALNKVPANPITIDDSFSREQIEDIFDATYGNYHSLEEIENTIKEAGAKLVKYLAKVCFIAPNEVWVFYADTKEDMTAQIEQAANGREYVVRYLAVASEN